MQLMAISHPFLGKLTHVSSSRHSKYSDPLGVESDTPEQCLSSTSLLCICLYHHAYGYKFEKEGVWGSLRMRRLLELRSGTCFGSLARRSVVLG